MCNGPKGLGVEGIGMVRKGDLWQSRKDQVRCGALRQGKAVAARMLWVGLDVVRQEVCSGLVRLGMKRSVKGQAGICKGAVG